MAGWQPATLYTAGTIATLQLRNYSGCQPGGEGGGGNWVTKNIEISNRSPSLQKVSVRWLYAGKTVDQTSTVQRAGGSVACLPQLYIDHLLMSAPWGGEGGLLASDPGLLGLHV